VCATGIRPPDGIYPGIERVEQLFVKAPESLVSAFVQQEWINSDG
jgi:hypothetical protein